MFEDLASQDRAAHLRAWSRAWLFIGLASLAVIPALGALLGVRLGPCPDDLALPFMLAFLFVPPASLAASAVAFLRARRFTRAARA